MPTYSFECGKCHHIFEKTYPMAESSTAAPTCPSCGKRKCKRDYSECTSISASVPRTVGSLADKNTGKLSEDEKTHITLQNTEYLRKPYEGPMPEGGSLIPKDPTTPPKRYNRTKRPIKKKDVT